MRFDVRAVMPTGQVQTISVHAPDAVDARRRLETSGHRILDIKALKTSSAPRSLRAKSKVSLTLFSQELLALLNAGLSLPECLEGLAEKDEGKRQQVLRSVHAAVREGLRLSDALALQPATFTDLYVGLVRAAEGTSNLPHALTRFIDYQRKVDQIRSKLISASIYPAILASVGTLVTFFLIGYVVPSFAVVYQDSGQALPWTSRILLQYGEYVAANKPLIGALLVVLVATIVVTVHKMRKGAAFGKVLASTPFVGHHVRLYRLSRIYNMLGMLLEGGIPVVAALRTVATANAPDVAGTLDRARESIEQGGVLSDAFQINSLTTPISLRLLRAGERSGQLGNMLSSAAEFYEGEVSRFIDSFTRSFEPILMTIIGLVVGGIVVLLYMPIFDLAGSLQ
ncbi:type II secretion system F family protein [Caballeronia sordidicola]|uniref:Putative secretion system X protein GspF n=1 Tax=Caballeronia sordidicola TaxID=196367 RepID=A0A226WUT1_CABSO|nr:type II secretion system F family protein [Caballeronia sordidicola]OXC74358.1 putative secretion system X protein GspF [Caballeronia sordidicola]